MERTSNEFKLFDVTVVQNWERSGIVYDTFINVLFHEW